MVQILTIGNNSFLENCIIITEMVKYLYTMGFMVLEIKKMSHATNLENNIQYHFLQKRRNNASLFLDKATLNLALYHMNWYFAKCDLQK